MKKHSDTNYLLLVPSPLIPHETAADNKVTLLVPRFRSRFWAGLFKNGLAKKPLLLHLDENGSAVWTLINSKRTVGEICEILKTNPELKIQPVEDRVTRFLSQLYTNKFISFLNL